MDDFKEYYQETMLPVKEEMKEIACFLDYSQKDISAKEFLTYYEEHDLKRKTIDALYKLSTYSSDNPDIMILHNAYIRFCALTVDASATLRVCALKNESPSNAYTELLLRMNEEAEVLKKIENGLLGKYDIEKKE